MMRIVFWCGLLLWACSIPAVAEEYPAWTLETMLERAVEKNARVEAESLRLEAAEAGRAAARGDFLPRITASAGLSKIDNPDSRDELDPDYIDQTSHTWRIGIQQNIFDGFGRWNNYARADLLRERSHEQLRKTLREVILQVRSAYYRLLRVRADIEAYQASVTRLESQKEAAEAFFEARMVPRLFILQTETALAEAHQRLSRAKNDEQVQLVLLRSLMGLDPEAPLHVEGDLQAFDPEPLLSLQEALSLARENSPDIAIAQLDVEISRRDMRTTRSRFSPSVDVYADYVNQHINYGAAHMEDRDRSYYSLGVNVTWELFSGGSTYYETRRQQRTMESAKAMFADAVLMVDSSVREIHLNVQEAENQIRIAHIRKTDAREAYEQAEMRMRMGTGTTLDLLDAQEKVTVAESSLNMAMADHRTALANLDRFIERLP